MDFFFLQQGKGQWNVRLSLFFLPLCSWAPDQAGGIYPSFPRKLEFLAVRTAGFFLVICDSFCELGCWGGNEEGVRRGGRDVFWCSLGARQKLFREEAPYWLIIATRALWGPGKVWYWLWVEHVKQEPWTLVKTYLSVSFCCLSPAFV